jgi:hypothetical protein
MAASIKITVKGSDNSGIDAPSVDDLLTQIQDFVSMLRNIESAIDDNGKGAIIWRVTNVTKNSPIAIEITPFPRQYAMNIDNRAEKIAATTSLGLKMLAETGERPAYFSDDAITKAEKIYKRVTNGLAETNINFSGYQSVPDIIISKQNAIQSVKNISDLKMLSSKPYRELGSVEGFITKVEKDGHGRPLVWLNTRLDGEIVRCVADGDALSRIGHMEIEHIWHGIRVRVFGELVYKALGKLEKISADTVQFFENDKNLPSIEAIIDPNFAQGIESVEYLKQLRKDG